MSIEVIREALSWLGTKFKHQGRAKITDQDLGGCDCLGMIMGIAERVNAKTFNGKELKLFDQNNYPKLLNSNILFEQLNQLLTRVEIEYMQPGDIILLRINNWPQHLAIIHSIAPNIIIIHSYIQARKVVQQHLPENWFKNIIAVYRFN
jgi:hypothetical protein